MKYPSKNMRRSDKVQLKEQTIIATNLLTNAAKMKITKAMANSKLQINNKLSVMNNNNNNNHSLIENEQNVTKRRRLAQMLEKDSRTPILQYVTSPSINEQHRIVDEQQQQQQQEAATAAIESLTQSLVQQQVNCIKETTTNTGAYKERMQVKVENSTAATTTEATTSTTIITTSTASATPTSLSGSHENVVFQSIHDVYNQRSLEPVSSKNSNTTTTTTQPQTSTTTLMSSPLSLLSSSSPSSQNVLKSIPTQVVVENCSSTEGTGTSSKATVTVTGGKIEVNSIENFQTENNRLSDVVVETRNNNQQHNHHQQQPSIVNNDKELIQNLSDASGKKTNTTTNNEDNISVINNNNAYAQRLA